MKTCTKCGFVGGVECFYRQKTNSKDGYQSHCKPCDNARVKLWALSNPEKQRTYNKKADSNKYVKNKQVIAKRNHEWKKQNPAKVLAMDAKRRAAVVQRLPKWLTDEDVLAIECKYSVCAMLNKFGVQKWHVDHIIPLQGKLVSGLHVPANLQVITEAANLAKSNIY
jgi:hypothetical protein